MRQRSVSARTHGAIENGKAAAFLTSSQRLKKRVNHRPPPRPCPAKNTPDLTLLIRINFVEKWKIPKPSEAAAGFQPKVAGIKRPQHKPRLQAGAHCEQSPCRRGRKTAGFGGNKGAGVRRGWQTVAPLRSIEMHGING